MNISLLQFILLVGVVLIGYMIIDAWKQRKLRIFHAIVFSVALFAIVWFIFQPEDLTKLGQLVWVSRGADFLVYLSIMFLTASVFSLIQRSLLHQQELTKLVSRDALREAQEQTKNLSLKRFSWIQSEYLFLIRAYNEETTIVQVIEEIISKWRSKIVICDDGSSDTTRELVQKLQDKYHKKAIIILLVHLSNRGPWAANKTLFEFAQHNMSKLWCMRSISYDADGQMDIEDMDNFLTATQSQSYDIVFWSRFMKGSKITNIPWSRKTILKVWRVISYIFTGIWLSDVSSWYRAYSLKAIKAIKLTSDRYSYQNDIIDSVKSQKLRFSEVPVHIRYTSYSLQKWQSNQSALKILIHMIYSSLFER